MGNLLRKLWRLDGTIDARTYAIGGVIGFILKYAVDWSVARFAFGFDWKPIYYWRLVSTSVQEGPHMMYAVLILLSIPFIWFGVTMTLLRLRDAGASPGWATLFFVPVANVVMFAILSFAKSNPTKRIGERSAAIESAIVAVVGAVALGVVGIVLSTHVLEIYGVGVFIAVPFCTGYLAARIHRARFGGSRRHAAAIALFSMLILGGLLFAVAWEGLICLLMALPISILVSLMGAWLAYADGDRGYGAPPSQAGMPTYFVVFLLPLVITGEAAVKLEAPTYAVSSSIDIDAPPERVWNNVVTFADIHENPEWYFRAGVAYPMRARIVGHGVGATRYCEFTTGSFIEPITVWDEPRRLHFSVTQNPPPMSELSFKHIDAPHLHGYLVSHGGEFRLEPLPGGRTRLIGTTWYQHHLWPAPYWRLWSDGIIHRIHMRVLRHIRTISESSTPRTT